MGKLKVINYDPKKAEAWDRFVEGSNNGTIFHRQDFLSYHPVDRFKRDDKMIYMNDELVGVFPLNSLVSERRKIGKSPYGGSYGGIVVKDIGSEYSKNIAGCLLKHLRENEYAELDICFSPECYYKKHNLSMEYLLLKMSKHRLVDRGMTSVIDLGRDNEFSDNFSRNLKKANSYCIEVRDSNNVEEFYCILKETVVEKHRAQLTHSLEEIVFLKEKMRDMVKLYVAYYKGIAVSGVLVFEDTSPCAFAFYNGHLREYAHTCSLHRVFACLIDHYRKKKRWLDLGLVDRFSSSYNWGLFRFKEGMGARGVYRDYYKIMIGEGVDV